MATWISCVLFWPFSARGDGRRRLSDLYLRLFRHLKSVVDLNRLLLSE
jgi:hypothetical protein